MRWFDRLVGELLHGLLRLVALVFSAASAVSIYWLFSDLADGWVAMLEAGAVTAAFALTGFLVMRAIALRVLSKRRLGMLLGIALVYEWVEVVANVLHALVALPRFAWLGGLVGRWPLIWLIVVVTLSILPVTTLVLAALDADLMRERGEGRTVVGMGPVPVSPSSPVRPVSPSPGPVSSVGAGRNAGGGLPVPLNGLQRYWESRRAGGAGN
jgi:hypothetical protein